MLVCIMKKKEYANTDENYYTLKVDGLETSRYLNKTLNVVQIMNSRLHYCSYIFFNLALTHQTEIVDGTSISPNFICHFLRERYRRDYLSDYVCMFYVYVMCMFCIVIIVFNLCAKFEFVKSPEVTLSD